MSMSSTSICVVFVKEAHKACFVCLLVPILCRSICISVWHRSICISVWLPYNPAALSPSTTLTGRHLKTHLRTPPCLHSTNTSDLRTQLRISSVLCVWHDIWLILLYTGHTRARCWHCWRQTSHRLDRCICAENWGLRQRMGVDLFGGPCCRVPHLYRCVPASVRESKGV